MTSVNPELLDRLRLHRASPDWRNPRRYAIAQMAGRLEGSGYYAPARATRDVERFLAAADRAAQALEDVWHAVEWADSGDSSEDAVRKAVEKFAPWPPPAEGEAP